MNNIYRHYKGGRYLYLNTATHCDSQEKLIIYKSLSDGKIWCRSEQEFFETLPDGRLRFEKEKNSIKSDVITNARNDITSIIGMNK